VGQLYQATLQVDRIIRERKLDPAEVKGQLSLRSGLLLSLVREDTPDDPVKLEKLRDAVRKVLKSDV
jgi:hypothetical protein